MLLSVLSSSVNAPSVQKLKVGFEAELPPFAFKDQQTGQIQGFEVDLVKEIGEQLQMEVEISDDRLDELILKVITSQIDLAIACLAMTLADTKWLIL